jgi:hypothetical protein
MFLYDVMAGIIVFSIVLAIIIMITVRRTENILVVVVVDLLSSSGSDVPRPGHTLIHRHLQIKSVVIILHWLLLLVTTTTGVTMLWLVVPSIDVHLPPLGFRPQNAVLVVKAHCLSGLQPLGP